MSAQLEQLLAYLERDGVTEVLFGSGRPIAMRTTRGVTNITARPLTDEQFATLLRASNAYMVIPAGDGESEPVDLHIGHRRAAVRVARRGNELVVSLRRHDAPTQTQPMPRVERPPAAPAPAPPPAAEPPPPELELAPEPQVRFAPKAASAAPRTRAPSQAPPPPNPGDDFISIGGLTGELTLDPLDVRGAPYTPPPPPMPETFEEMLRIARERGATDLHIAANRQPMARVDGTLVPLVENIPVLPAPRAEELLKPLLETSHLAKLDEVGYIDFAREAPDGGRLRANISRTQQGLKGAFRIAMPSPPTLEQLGLPPDLAKMTHHHQGLIIIAGPSGQGKTTTLAALVDLVNSTSAHHILMIEDPVEIIHPRKKAVISQREAGSHTASFARGLKASLREDPDVIVIGELRDRESVEIALTAAETGHLVITTMSTPSASKTIDRLIDMFPPEEHSQVRASVAGALRAIIAQRLVTKRGGGVVPVIELVTGVLPLAVMIREDKLYQLPNLLQRGRAFGMIRFDESLLEHVRAGRVDNDVAIAVAENKKDVTAQLAGPAAAPPPPAKTSQLWGFGKKDQ